MHKITITVPDYIAEDQVQKLVELALEYSQLSEAAFAFTLDRRSDDPQLPFGPNRDIYDRRGNLGSLLLAQAEDNFRDE